MRKELTYKNLVPNFFLIFILFYLNLASDDDIYRSELFLGVFYVHKPASLCDNFS